MLKVASGKIQLTMKSDEERRQESDMSESGIGAGSTRKARNTLEAALAKVGFKHSPEQQPEVSHSSHQCIPGSCLAFVFSLFMSVIEHMVQTRFCKLVNRSVLIWNCSSLSSSSVLLTGFG